METLTINPMSYGNQAQLLQPQSNRRLSLPRLMQAGAVAMAVIASAACGPKAPPAANAPAPTATATKSESAAKPAVPASFTANCSKCHGAAAEGADNGKGKTELLNYLVRRSYQLQQRKGLSSTHEIPSASQRPSWMF